jgi:hypothetical protein
MPLTDSAIRNAKPKDKPYKLADGAGLYLLGHPEGRKMVAVGLPLQLQAEDPLHGCLPGCFLEIGP